MDFASTISSSTMGLINPGCGIIVSSRTALLNSIAALITNEFVSKLKIPNYEIGLMLILCYMEKL